MTFPIAYRILATKHVDGNISVSLDENGIDEPNADIVLVWKDENDLLWVRYGDRDYRIGEITVSSLDFSVPDNTETVMIVGNNKVWSKNANQPVLTQPTPTDGTGSTPASS